MKKIEEKIKSMAKPASSVKHQRKIVRVINSADKVKLNKTIESKILQNRRERIATSEEISRDKSLYKSSTQQKRGYVKSLHK